NNYPLRGDPHSRNFPTLLKSRSTSETEMESFWGTLRSHSSGDPENFQVVLQTAQPRIWDEWARNYYGTACSSVESTRSSQEFVEAAVWRAFRTEAPPFGSAFGGHNTPRYANDVEFRFYGSDEPLAEALPEAEQKLERTLSESAYKEFQFSSRGLVHLAKHAGWPFRASVPRAEQFFKAWLEAKGWSAELSDKGYVAKQILKQVGGEWGIQTLADEGLISLLNSLANEKVLNAEAFRAELHKICNQQRWSDTTSLAKRLVDLNMVQLGLDLQCSHCRQHSWFSIKTADYELTCPKCLQVFKFPSHTPKQIAWAYRSLGPFTLPGHGYGAFTVLLTFRFFARLLDGATTPLLSFTAK